MSRPKLLDVFCGAGGAAMGYHRAGFDVIGVDKQLHPEYPFPHVVMDAMHALAGGIRLDRFDVIHASPPCQGYSTITPDSSKATHPRLIEPVRDALHRWGGVYVIENVEGAARELRAPVKLCGSTFGLRVRRHRYFEVNRWIWSMPCLHRGQGRPVGVYGDHPQDDEYYRRPDGTLRGNKAKTIAEAQLAMGVDWMTDWDDLTDAIPPTFTQYLGEQLISHLAALEAS